MWCLWLELPCLSSAFIIKFNTFVWAWYVWNDWEVTMPQGHSSLDYHLPWHNICIALIWTFQYWVLLIRPSFFLTQWELGLFWAKEGVTSCSILSPALIMRQFHRHMLLHPARRSSSGMREQLFNGFSFIRCIATAGDWSICSPNCKTDMRCTT